jgi:uncharacterized protein
MNEKIKTYLVIASLSLAFLSTGSSSESHSGLKTFAAASETTDRIANTVQKLANQSVDLALRKAIDSYIENAGIPTDASQSFLSESIDLNDDGVLDALVLLTGSNWCGTGGCTMVVFQGIGNEFRLVSSSSIIQTPLIVSETRTNGWRDLIVDLRGGGATPGKVALKFDGKSYPSNPSTEPTLPSDANLEGKIVFPEESEPQSMTETTTEQSSDRPSFDCQKAEGEVETLICKDSELASLDRKMDSIYREALKKAEQFPAGDLVNFKAEQIGWIKGRNDCWKAQETTVRECVQQNYLDRLAELQANFALVPAQEPVFFSCNNNPANEIVATFYQTDPPTARLERGDTTITVFLRPSGSGSKYEGQNVTFWTKGEEASVKWNEEKLECQAR